MMHIPGDLPDAALAYLESFPAGEGAAFPLTPLDRTGVPVWVVALFPDSPVLDGIMPYGVGYGIDEGQAILGGLGEIAEMVFPTLTLSARRKTRGSYNQLAASLGARAVADPLTLCLPAGSPVNGDTVLEWVEARRWAGGDPVLVPIDLAAYSAKELSPGYRPFTTIISNGMGAGPDLDWAIGHGLCEILQRDGNGLLFRALDRGILLDLPDDLPAETTDLLARFEAAGIRVLPKFATDEFGLCNLYCTGFDQGDPPTPIMLTACGEACHPDRTQALTKAITEYAASRARKAFAHGGAALAKEIAPDGYVARFMAQAGGAAKSSDPRAFAAMQDWSTRSPAKLRSWLADNVHAVRGHKPFDSLPHQHAPDSRARGALARAAVEGAGFDILYVDMSPPGAGVSCVKVIVPGMEVETMSYGRIGPRGARKALALDNGLVSFDPPSSSRRPIRMTEEARATFPAQPVFDTARAADLVGPLYPLYREPEAHHVAAAHSRIPVTA